MSFGENTWQAKIENLRELIGEKYGQGFPILREIMQNASDRDATVLTVLRCDEKGLEHGRGLDGRRDPFQVAGLLFVNDGTSKAEDRNSLNRIGDSGKRAEQGVVGRHGLGQKSLFHYCDVFFYAGYDGDVAFCDSLNPYADEDAPENCRHAQDWEGADHDQPGFEGSRQDGDLLRRAAGRLGMEGRTFMVWLPFRQEAMKVGNGLSQWRLKERENPFIVFQKPEDIAALLALTRLQRLSFVDGWGGEPADWVVPESASRFRPFEKQAGERRFSFDVAREGAAAARISGIERLALGDERLDKVKECFAPEGEGQQKPKADNHGAVIIVRTLNSSTDAGLRLASYLPMDGVESDWSLKGAPKGLQILLHGAFFTDRGRQHLLETNTDDEDDTRRRWNARLLDRIVLPLLGPALRDALEHEHLTDAELAVTIAALQGLELVRTLKERTAALALPDTMLARSLTPDGSRWEMVKRTNARPLPKAAFGEASTFWRLLPELAEQVKVGSRALVDAEATLALEAVNGWSREEIEALLDGTDAATLRTKAGAAMLRDALESAGHSGLVGMERLLDKALAGGRIEAEDAAMKAILSRAEPWPVLWSAVKKLDVQIMLQRGRPCILPVEWRPDRWNAPFGPEQLCALLPSLGQSIAGDDNSAHSLALEAVQQSKMTLQKIAETCPDLKSVPILHAKRADTGDKQCLTIGDVLAKHASRRLMREGTGDGKIVPGVFAGAMGWNDLFVLASNFSVQDWGLEVQMLDRRGALLACRESRPSGSVPQRKALLSALNPGSGDDSRALRALCAGCAVQDSTQLFYIEEKGGVAAALAALCHQAGGLLVPAEIASDVLSGDVRQHLKIGKITVEGAAAWVHKFPDAVLAMTTTAQEGLISFLGEVAAALPLHRQKNGGLMALESLWHVDKRPVPDLLRSHVAVLEPADDPEIRKRQTDWMKEHNRIWSETAEIETALGLVGTVNDIALAEVIFGACKGATKEALSKLEDAEWLPLARGSRANPGDVLVLSSAVEEAARTVLPAAKRDFPCQGDIAPALLRSEAWEAAKTTCGFPDEETSRELVLEMLKDTPGNLGEGTPEDHAALAKAGFEDGSTEWALMSALLKEHAASEVIEAFAPLEDDSQVRARLRALGDFARQKQDEDSACARRVFDAAFTAAVKAPSAERRRARLSEIQVMTAAGQWQASSDVAENAEVEKRHRLASGLDEPLQKALRGEGPVIGEPAGNACQRKPEEGRNHLLAVLKPLHRLAPEGARLCYALFANDENAVEAWGSAFGPKEKNELEHSVANLKEPLRSKSFDRTLIAIALEDAGKSVRATALDGSVTNFPVSGEAGVFISARPSERGSADWLVSLAIPAPKDAREASQLLSELARRVVLDAHGWVNLWRDPEEGEATLPLLFKRASTGESGAIARLLVKMKDQLPGLLKGFKSDHIPALKAPLDAWRDGEHSLDECKAALWKAAEHAAARTELGNAVRNRIKGFGYGEERTLLELFQNAHDAYADINASGTVRVDLDGSLLRFLHWGRCVSVPAATADADTARRQRADLENMLMPGWSDKGDGNVGTFGLGFKCVHLLSDMPGVVSGTESCHILGGFIPKYWRDGLELTRNYDKDNRYATLIHLPLREDAHAVVDAVFAKLRGAAEGLLLLSGHVIHLEMPGGTWRIGRRQTLVEGVELVCIATPDGQRDFLVLMLAAAKLVLRLNGGVPDASWKPEPNLWRLAPLGESIDAHWILDPALPVDAGRTGLQGEDGKQKENIGRLAETLRDRLVTLQATGLAGLRPEGEREDAFDRAFWAGMRDVLAPDHEDEGLRSALHEGGGWAGAARRCAILPNDLDGSLVATEPELTRIDASLKDRVTSLRALPVWADKRFVVTDVGEKAAAALGIGKCWTAEAIAKKQIKLNPVLSKATAAALGGIVDLISRDVHAELAKDARFDAQKGGARSISFLSDDAKAPPEERLSDKYCEEGRKFFKALKKQVQDDNSGSEKSQNDQPKKNTEEVLRLIHEWWIKERETHIPPYENRVYPKRDISGSIIRRISATRDPAWMEDDAKAEQNTRDWFTLLALGCFRTLPWNKDTMNSDFLDHRSVSDHWADIASTDPSEDFAPWRDMLHHWYRDDSTSIDFHTWRRTFGDLYTLRRYLPEYQRLFGELPKLKDQGLALSFALTPAVVRTDIKAPPLQSLLRHGAPWIIRELCRHAGEDMFYSHEEAQTLAPWCWSPRSGLVSFLNSRVGLSLDTGPTSENIHDAVRRAFIVNKDRVSFSGDCDLPIDILSRDKQLAKHVIDDAQPQQGSTTPNVDVSS